MYLRLITDVCEKGEKNGLDFYYFLQRSCGGTLLNVRCDLLFSFPAVLRDRE